MYTLLNQKNLYNKKVQNKYVFLTLKVDFDQDNEIEDIHQLKNFLEDNLNKEIKVDYDQPLEFRIFKENELMIYIISTNPQERKWEQHIRNLLKKQNIKITQLDTLNLNPYKNMI